MWFENVSLRTMTGPCDFWDVSVSADRKDVSRRLRRTPRSRRRDLLRASVACYPTSGDGTVRYAREVTLKAVR